MINVGEAPRLFVKKGRIGMMMPNPSRSRNMVINATSKGLFEGWGIVKCTKINNEMNGHYVTHNATNYKFLH